MITEGITPPLKFSEYSLELPLSDWTFDPDAEVNPEEECPEKLELDSDQVSLIIGKDLTIQLGDFQYSPNSLSDINNGVVECNTNFTYEVSMGDVSDFPPFIRYDPEELKIWILPHAEEEIGSYEILIVATEQPQTSYSKVVEQALDIVIS
jgi:hypothetical protein